MLLADGKTIPIAKVKAGDKVTATDPYQKVTAARPVGKVIRHYRWHAMAAGVLIGGAVIQATSQHPIWDATTRQFTYAASLRPGDKLLEPNDKTVTVKSVWSYQADLTAYNLDVSGIHTYYVQAGTTAVLVHNSCGETAAGENAEPITPSTRNGALAGSTHPATGVPFDENGYPDFSQWRHPDVPDVTIEPSGTRAGDFARANEAAGLDSTPEGYTWHHNQEPGVMQLIETAVHAATGHTGGFSIWG